MSQLEAKELAPRSFFSLPAEIRIDILNRALTSNNIFWRPQDFSANGPMSECQRTASSNPTWNAPLGHSDTFAIPGFLTASRQSYEEGMPIFYKNNVFFLPLGPLEITVDFLEQIRPEYRSLIKVLGLTMDCRDLGFGTLDFFEWDRQSEEKADPSAYLFKAQIQTALKGIWDKKLDWIVSQQNVEKVVIQFEFGNCLRKHGRGMPWLMHSIVASIEGDHIRTLVEEHGWKKLQSALDAELSFNDRAQPNNEMWNYKNRARLEYSVKDFSQSMLRDVWSLKWI
ncbi:MAG: hypothetical protein LQ342_005657 [Letrouitia transgressa]|nr:MAG: hypothetical protein LQ342_005657 [Letrouitia transgressa]